jgi:glycosyltransferase involved in cell wall biosynthesis
MKVGIVVDNELNNDNRVLREIQILKEQGYEIFVLCFGFGKTFKKPVNQISITRININRKLKDVLFFFLNTIPLYEWMWASQIKKFIISNNIEVLHVHDLYMSRAAHYGIKKAGRYIPLILDLHENYPFTITTYNWTKGFIRSRISKPEEWQKKEKVYLRYATGLIVLSTDYRDLLIKRYPYLTEEIFAVLPNVPDISQPLKENIKAIENPFNQGFPILFYYGVIAERRGVFDTIDVFIHLVKDNYPVNLLLIGPVDKKDKPKFSDLLNMELLAGRVHYIPWIDSIELPSYLDIVDICIAPFHKNPQHESGVANKIYEYMLGGKPLIVSNCQPQQNLIEKHKCGLVFENQTEFHDAIIKLAGDSDMRTSLGKNGYNAIVKEYNMEFEKENLVQLYKSISDKAKTR